MISQYHYESSQDGTLQYRADILKATTVELGIKLRRLMGVFGHSNPSTVTRWLEGKDIYLFSLLKICNHYSIDLLRFFTYRGHTFGCTLDDIVKAEEAGIDIAALTNPEPSDIQGMPNVEAGGTDESKGAQGDGISIDKASLNDVLRHISEIQMQAFNHEREAVESLRVQMQREVTKRDTQILNQSNEIVRLRERINELLNVQQRTANKAIIKTYIADESGIGDKYGAEDVTDETQD